MKTPYDGGNTLLPYHRDFDENVYEYNALIPYPEELEEHAYDYSELLSFAASGGDLLPHSSDARDPRREGCVCQSSYVECTWYTLGSSDSI